MGKIKCMIMIACFIVILTPMGWGKPLTTVELKKVSALSDLIKITGTETMRKLPGLWVVENDFQYSLRVGLFSERDDAEPLLKLMVKTFPDARIVETKPPTPDQWMPSFFRISLKNMGFIRPILMQGVHAHLSFQFPWSRAFSLTGSSLHLSLRFSPVVKNLSTLTVMAEGIPLRSIRLSNLPRLSIDVPLDALENIPIGKKLNIELRGYFTISGDQCLDEATGNLWMLVDNKSFLEVKSLRPPQTVQNFFINPSLTLNILSQKVDRDYVETLCNLAIISGFVTRSRSTHLTFQSYSPEACNVFIGSYGDDIRIFGNDLYLTSRGVRTLVSRWLSTLIFSRIKNTSYATKPFSLPHEITFEKLGYSGSLMRGIGELVASIPLSASQLGGWPGNMLCTLLYSHSPISDRERAFLKIRFNGVLLESREIKGQGGINNVTFSIPKRYFQPRNRLDIAFAYYRNSGNCQGNFPEMEVSVMKDSFFTIKSFQRKPPITIGAYPAICLGRGALVLKDLSEESWRPLIPVFENLGRNHTMPFPITLVSWNTFNKGDYAFGILNLGCQLPPELHPMVRLDRSLLITDPVKGKILLKIDTPDPAAAIQTFYTDRGVPIVLYTQKPGARIAPGDMIEAISNPTLANVTLFSNHTWAGMEIGEKLRVIYPGMKGFSFYWAQYRLIVFILFGVFILIFLFFLFHKLATRREET